MTNLETYSQYAELLMDELNVKEIRYSGIKTEKGNLDIVFNGTDWRWMLGDKDVTTRKLLDITPKILGELIYD